MQPLPHQLTKAQELFDILRTCKYAYLNGEVRSGKTLTALLALSKSKSIKRILIITKKAAIPGILKFINDSELSQYWSHQTHDTLNYEALGNIKLRTQAKSGKTLAKPVKELNLKVDPDSYDFILIDEAHRLGKLGKPSQTYLVIKSITGSKPFLCMSGTPIVESPNHIYYQMSISTRTPFLQNSFYDFFRDWGIPTYLKLHGRMITQYKSAKPELLQYIKQFTVTMTQADANISDHSKAIDNIHYVEPSAGFIKSYNQLFRDKILPIQNQVLVADSTMKLRTSLHQMESGIVLVDGTPIDLNFKEKIQYIKQHWPDSPSTGIMAYYRAEYDLLKSEFPNSEIYSSIRNAEGVDLSHLSNFIIFSFGFSGAKWIQLRNRIVNVNSTSASNVHVLLMRNSISQQVYECVTAKKDFNDASFKKSTKPIKGTI